MPDVLYPLTSFNTSYTVPKMSCALTANGILNCISSIIMKREKKARTHTHTNEFLIRFVWHEKEKKEEEKNTGNEQLIHFVHFVTFYFGCRCVCGYN